MAEKQKEIASSNNLLHKEITHHTPLVDEPKGLSRHGRKTERNSIFQQFAQHGNHASHIRGGLAKRLNPTWRKNRKK